MDSYNKLPWYKIEYLRKFCTFFSNKEHYHEQLYYEEEQKIVRSVLLNSDKLFEDSYVISNFKSLLKAYDIVYRVHALTVRNLISKARERDNVDRLDNNYKLHIYPMIKKMYFESFYCDDRIFFLAFELIWEYMSICLPIWEYAAYIHLTEVHVNEETKILNNIKNCQTNILFDHVALKRLVDGYFISEEDIKTIDSAINIESTKLGFRRESLTKLILLEKIASNPNLTDKASAELEKLLKEALAVI